MRRVPHATTMEPESSIDELARVVARQIEALSNRGSTVVVRPQAPSGVVRRRVWRAMYRLSRRLPSRWSARRFAVTPEQRERAAEQLTAR